MSKFRDWVVAPMARAATEAFMGLKNKFFKSAAQKEAEATARVEEKILNQRAIIQAEGAGLGDVAAVLRQQAVRQELAPLTQPSVAGTAARGFVATAAVTGAIGLTSGVVGTITDGAGWTGEPGQMSWGAQVGNSLFFFDGKDGTSLTSSYIDVARRRKDPEYDQKILKMGSKAQTEFQIPVRERREAAIAMKDQEEADKVRPAFAAASAAAGVDTQRAEQQKQAAALADQRRQEQIAAQNQTNVDIELSLAGGKKAATPASQPAPTPSR